jgi:putative membrane protein
MDATPQHPPATAGLRSGLRNGVVLALLVVVAVLALNWAELPGLGAALAELPVAVAVSAAVHLPQIALTAAAWRALLPRGLRPGVLAMMALRWYRESANALLPAGAIIGQAAAARLLARRGVPGDLAGATATVDLTLEAVSQFFFTLAGVLLLVAFRDTGGLAAFAWAGLGIAVAGAVAMVLAQRRLPLALAERGLARLARRWPAIRPSAIRDFQAAILALHADTGRLLAAVLWHTASWVLGAVEIWGVLALLGHPVSLADALVIEALAQALRNVGFLLPGALAVQEGAIIGAAALCGVPPAAALAVALARRAREVMFSLPGLLAWQRAELRKGPVT